MTGGVALGGGAGKKITAKSALLGAKKIATRNITRFLASKIGPKGSGRDPPES